MKKVTKQTFQLFWSYVTRYRALSAAVFITTTLAFTVNALTPLLYKRFFDILTESTLPTADIAVELTRVIFYILGLNLLMQVLFRIAGYSHLTFESRIMRDIADDSFAYLQKHSVGFFINRFVGSLVRKLNRLVRAFEVLGDQFVWSILPLIIRVVVVVIVFFTLNPLLGLGLAVWVVVMLMVNYVFSIYKLRYDSEQARIDSEVTGRLADTITNNINLKLFTAFKDEWKAFRQLTNSQHKVRQHAWSLDEHMNFIQSFLFIALEFGIFYGGIQLWQKGTITVGDFVLFQSYFLMLFTQIWELGRMIRKIYEQLAEAEEMVTILNTPHEIQDKPRAKKLAIAQGKIEFRNIDFAYSKTRNVLKNFNLVIEPGERVGLVGPSGSGKTTITALLFRYYDILNGGITIDNQNIQDVTQESLRNGLALVPQDPLLFHRTLKENIGYGQRGASVKDIIRASTLAHCHEFIQQLPYKYETYVGERGIKLSGGERQRVAIARAILKNAPILVLDEATSSLDSESEHLIQDALHTLMEGKTTIVIAHRLSTIMQMDRIVVIEYGKLKEMGTHKELLQKGGLYKKLWDMQAGGFIE